MRLVPTPEVEPAAVVAAVGERLPANARASTAIEALPAEVRLTAERTPARRVE